MIFIATKNKIYLCFLCLFCISVNLFSLESNDMVSLTEAATRLEADLFWDPLFGSVVISKNGHQASFSSEGSIVLFDYKKAEIIDTLLLQNKTLYISKAFFDRLDLFFESLPPPVQYRVGAILIDPGHGGKDPGASGKAVVNGKTITIKEKDIVLEVALDLHAKMKKAWPDKKILLTRSDDTYPSLEARVEMANSVKLEPHEAIIYISIHANSAFNTKSSGFEVWYLTPDYRRTVIDKTDTTEGDILPILNSMMEEEFTTESILIAKSIMDGLAAQIGTQSINRGLKEEAWFVVRNARMPSVLIELGFVSNPEEAALLADSQYLKRCSTGIYNGINSFVAYFEGLRSFTK